MTIEIKNEYQWNEGFGVSMDINKVVSELNKIQEEKGEVNLEFVVEHAKNKSSVLHNYFIWDNKTAAQKYRLQQASELLRRIEVKVVKDGEPKILRAFEVFNRTENISNYVSFDLADGMKRTKQIVLGDLNRCLSRLNPYAEYNSISVQIKTAIEELINIPIDIKTALSAVN